MVTILPATAPPYQCRASLTIGSGPGGPSGSPDAEVAGWSSARSSPSTIRSSRPRSSSKCEISSEWHGIFHRSGSRICHQMALSRFDAGTSALWLSRSGVPGMHLRSEAPWAPVAPTPRRGVSRTRRWLGSESACCAREPVPFGDKSCCHSREISERRIVTPAPRVRNRARQLAHRAARASPPRTESPAGRPTVRETFELFLSWTWAPEASSRSGGHTRGERSSPLYGPHCQCRSSLTSGSGLGGPCGSPDAEVAGWSSARSSPSTIPTSRARSSSREVAPVTSRSLAVAW